MRKQKKRKKRSKKTLLLIVLLFIFGTIIGLALYQSQLQTNPQRKPADEYFEIVSAAVEPMANDKFEEDVWIIHAITFQIKAVGGDAHDVIILAWAGEEEPHIVGDIQRGGVATIFPPLMSPKGYRVVKNEDGMFPVTVRVKCREAYGRITIYLPPEGGYET